ncbi:Binding-protein-dependent transport systems inner membrane component [Marinomonas sp. MED121]|uniref:ABC transporter permease subunit n=1 Tax=Marinomonas sp. MED121 TaxID=314277 RepID=UPI0000690C4E|nr:ABC transporter permease subunit [Marinomonas sp. MED121]EAQ64826.1 Binding-protein-dependent transport systems inner membrane component [Marinomonas sp. MED121]
MSKTTDSQAPDLDFNSPALIRHRKVRRFKDKAATAGIALGGSSVILAVLLICFYLLYEVLPLFAGAEIEQKAAYSLPLEESGASHYLTLEEQNEVAMRVAQNGSIIFFDSQNGELIKHVESTVSADMTAFAMEDDTSRIMALAYENGELVIAQHNYKISYPDNKRKITPVVEYPFGKQAIKVADFPIKQVAIRNGEAALSLVVMGESQSRIVKLEKEVNFITEEVEITQSEASLPFVDDAKALLISGDQRYLYIATKTGAMTELDLRNLNDIKIKAQHQLTKEGAELSSMSYLLGQSSIMVADDTGRVSQWFNVRDEQNVENITFIRDVSQPVGIIDVAMEQRRKGFATLDNRGVVVIYNATSSRQVINEKLSDDNASNIAFSPRANGLILEDDKGIRFFDIDNEHPEVSWGSIWSEIWYEGYQEPTYTWQSSAANNDFEPKYSLMPLAFGTLKAAFYAMVMAVPLAICGAIYTAYFMAPALRRKVKPVIELMEALPTVILGFLAGLFFAPFLEENLAAAFSILLVLPLGILLFAFVWSRLPNQIRWLLPDGWQPLILIPVVIFLGWACVAMSPVIELNFFAGDMRGWITNDLGITFDQRNALVVGFAMGFAVIPTIFSITEDAIFSVPKALTQGSLALGATYWQTMVRVVLPTASPGIFSAIMIGMGRAVGETMIVLMATGNTPIMDFNIFEGMRTLAANLAVEVPESEVDSSHYRILFLAAFVLFLFTFVVNTIAETVRQHLRKKYGSL